MGHRCQPSTMHSQPNTALCTVTCKPRKEKHGSTHEFSIVQQELSVWECARFSRLAHRSLTISFTAKKTSCNTGRLYNSTILLLGNPVPVVYHSSIPPTTVSTSKHGIRMPSPPNYSTSPVLRSGSILILPTFTLLVYLTKKIQGTHELDTLE